MAPSKRKPEHRTIDHEIEHDHDPGCERSELFSGEQAAGERSQSDRQVEDRAPAWRAGPFYYQRLDAYKVAREALVLGETISRQLPNGYAKLKDQLRRALLSSYLNIAEAASRTGKDRRSRFRTSGGEAAEAAAAIEAVAILKLAPASQTTALTVLLGRLCAMLTRLAQR